MNGIDQIAEHFESNFSERGEVGASVSIWRDGEEMVSLHHGFTDRAKTEPWTADTLVPVWSITKGFAAACVLMAMEDEQFDLGTPIAKIWPELGSISFGQVLSHQAGLAALENPPSLSDYDAVIHALESQSRQPNWEPGTRHGYHPRTFGYLTDEIVRRLSGAASLGAYWRERIAEPLKLDVWIGLPESEDSRVAEMIPAKMKAGEPVSKFYQEFGKADSFVRKAFESPRGVRSPSDFNRPETRRLSIPSFTGIASARGVARFYAEMAGGNQFSETIRSWAETTLVSGTDETLLDETAFSAGFMKTPHLLPSSRSFGHPGAGGSHAFAFPEQKIGFAYVMNQMELSVTPTQKALGFLDPLRNFA
ncbi:MAG: serine hydrolase domain-containing protein [Verrucomicrobiota bacterium]